MKQKFIVANWKSYKSFNEAKEWFRIFYLGFTKELNLSSKEIIVCPPFPFIPAIYDLIMQIANQSSFLIKLGSQDVSPFEQGAYTGEVTASQLSSFCAYGIVGHSERRQFFNEDDKMLVNKSKMLLEQNINPIFCVQSKETLVPQGVKLIAYEPVFAIGSGKADTPSDAEEVAAYFKTQHAVSYVLYGGSVNSDNVASFTNAEHIDGVLVGGASRDADKFRQIVLNA